MEKVLFTGKEFILFDFEGDRTRSFSELRLKKPPMSDLSSLISSLYYAALAALEVEAEPGKLGGSPWLPWMEAWFAGMKTAFLNGYLPEARAAGLIPPSEEDWNILLDETGGPNHVNNLCFAPIHADTRNGSLIYTPSYYYIGHFSKFIRPNAKRVSTACSRSALLSASFLNEDGKMATIVMNHTGNPVTYKLYVNAQAVEETILPHAMQTLVY